MSGTASGGKRKNGEKVTEDSKSGILKKVGYFLKKKLFTRCM